MSKLDLNSSALLMMDCQGTILDMLPAEAREALLDGAARALEAARGAGLRVIHVMVAFREGHPEISERNLGGAAAKAANRLVLGAPGTEIHPRLAPLPGEALVLKKRVSAFAGSDLDVLLRGGGIDTLLLAGVATGGVVLSTLRAAADLDYRLLVLREACADADPQVHACLLDKLFPRQARVLDHAEFAAELA